LRRLKRIAQWRLQAEEGAPLVESGEKKDGKDQSLPIQSVKGGLPGERRKGQDIWRSEREDAGGGGNGSLKCRTNLAEQSKGSPIEGRGEKGVALRGGRGREKWNLGEGVASEIQKSSAR